MKDLVRRRIETFLRVQAFGKENDSLFPAGSFAREQFAAIDGVLKALETHTGAQAAGLNAARQSTLSKAAARDELVRDLEAINRTVRPLAARTPGMLEQFRVPHGQSEQEVLAAARAVAEAARPIKMQLVKRGLPEDFIEDLEADARELQDAIARKNEGRDSHVTATAAIDDLVETGVEALRELDPTMRNTFAEDPAKLASWLSASRVERRARRANGEDRTPDPPDTNAPHAGS